MTALTLDIRYIEDRNRLTTAFRIILAIPHLIVATLWNYLAQILSVVQWFVIVFTGQRNEGMWNMQHSFLGYYTRVQAYSNLMYDDYPPFGADPTGAWVRYDFRYEQEANRLTNGLRIIWAIPAIIIGLVLSFAFAVVAIVSWFAIVFTGKHPRGMFVFMLRCLRYITQMTSYVLLMTDTYPKWE